MTGVRVIPVAGEQLDRFVEVPFAVEAGDAAWIPPLRAIVAKEISGSAAPGGALQAFLGERDGRVVGRVAALLVPRLADASGVPLGQVGYYACADDREASAALFQAALGWLAARGAREVVGPMNGGVHRTHRLMTRGFERGPFLLEPRNPPWYPDHFLAAGFAVAHRWTTYELPRAALPPLQATLAALARRRAGGLAVEFVDARDGAAALSRFHALLDAVWAGHPGWAPFPLEELAATFGALLPLLPARHLAILRDEHARDVGIGFMYPDWADEVRALGGDAAGWGRWMGRARARRVVAHTVAVLPEVRNRAAGAKMIAAALEVALEEGYEELVFALTTERFRFWGHRFAPTREYALYRRAL